MSTRLDEVLTAITDMWTAEVPVVVPGTVIFDGPVPTSRELRRWVVVGSSGDDSVSEDATVEQTESSLGPGGWVDEQGTITCSAWAFAGSTDAAARRLEAIALLDACEASIAAHRDLDGLLSVGFVRVAPSRLALQQRQTEGGSIARLIFTVDYRTTITT